MPTIVMTTWPRKVDGSVRGRALTFLQKLAADDTTSGLHVEPIAGAADARVRTGRVDQFWRAVMFRLDSGGERHYVVHGVWPHDDAITVARSARLTLNPINGLPRIEEVAAPPASVRPPTEPHAPVVEPLLVRLGRTRAELVDRLGVPPDVADEALAAPDEDAVVSLAEIYEGWLGLVLVDLAAGEPVDSVVARLDLDPPGTTPADGEVDDDVLASLRRPAARTQFSFVAGEEELQRVIEEGDFRAWRIFLHPEQRRFVDRRYSGPARISGGAGTGKTVVLIHRAAALARRDPRARVVLTTFTTNLARALQTDLARLDPSVPQAGSLGEPGACTGGVDALAAAAIRQGGDGVAAAVRSVLGEDRAQPQGRTTGAVWRSVLDTATTDLPPEIANETFLASEYALVVLPQRVTDEDGYLRVRRPGRGVALDRAKRAAVWALIAAYRARGRTEGTLDFAEAAAVAAAHLEATGPVADHVLVDEGQDLAPVHWQLLRALVAPGADDLFIAEDSHQRIYGAPVVLGRLGIRVVGRARRLTLNYRTTAQTLRYSLSILDGADYVDLDQHPEQTDYRSARTGPDPQLVRVPSIAEGLRAVARLVRAWTAEGLDPADPATVAVLAHDRFACERLVTSLGEHGVPARLVDRDQPPTDRVAVMTMHRAKGTEFARVVLANPFAVSPGEQARLADLDDAERADADLRRRSLTYVAATRARDELAVVELADR